MSNMKKILSFILALMMLVSMLAACAPKDDTGDDGTSGPAESSGEQGKEEIKITEFDKDKKYTYNSWQTGLSANWNPHDYEDANSSDQMSYLIDSFYTFAFNDELHPMEDTSRTPFDGYVIIPSMAAGMPVDVTEEVAKEHPDWVPEGATSGYAYAIPMREDLYFDTGYHITANTYVEGMKRILDYKFQNYRSTDVYSGTYGIAGAEDYFFQGHENFKSFSDMGSSYDDYIANGGKEEDIYIDIGGFWGIETADGKTYASVTDDTMIRDPAVPEGADEDYVSAKYLWDNYLGPNGVLTSYTPGYAGILKSYPANVAFEDTVGFYAKDEYTLVEVFKASCSGFTLFYNAIQDSLILVDPDIYDKCATQQADGTWASTYMTSVETSPSYGPYSLTDYQTDKVAHYSRNDKWYGYKDDVNNIYKDPTDGNVYRLYQTTDIDIQVLDSAATAKNMFLAGELATYGLQADDVDEYRNSEYCFNSPGPNVFFTLLTGNKDGLDAREAADGFDTSKEDIQTILCPSFRKAFAVSFDRQAFCDETSPQNIPGYGIFGTTIIYDPDTAAYYRDTDVAKKALCDFYSVDTSKYSNLDDAVDSITGFDPEAAKELYTAAFQESLDAGYITDEDNDGKCDQTITIMYALSAESDSMTRRIDWLDKAIVEATKGTPFENKVHVGKTAPLGSGSEFADALKAGSADVCLAGWDGSAMDPYNLLTAYTHEDQAYAAEWYYPKQDMLTLTLDGKEITMSVYDWAEAVTGNNTKAQDGKTYNFGTNDADQETRMQILAGVEGKLLETYTYIPFINNGSLALLSQKVYYVTDEYNAVMARGGIAYLKYNYDDDAWKTFCDEQIAEHGMIQY